MDNNLKKKIGQMFICGFSGYEMDEDIKYIIEKYYVGNAILLSKNVKDEEQLVKLNSSLKMKILENTDTIPFIAIDEEGGTVSRLRDVYGEYLGQYAIGALGDEKFAFNQGAELGHKLSKLGFNLNFAPVADINSNSENQTIGIRSFGSDVDLVKKLTLATAKGYESSYTIPVLKHFPGLGDIGTDNHFNLPILDKSLSKIKETELVPFQHAIDNGLRALLVSHIMFLDFDNKYPASMSKRFLRNLLREEMGYKNLVIADNIGMGAITNSYGVGDAAVIALNAGVDMFLISTGGKETQIKAIESIYNAVEEGIITEERIKESFDRICYAKFITMRPSPQPDVIDFEKKYREVLDTNNFEKLNLDKSKTIAFAINQFVSHVPEDITKDAINLCDIFEKYTGIKTMGFDKDLRDVDIFGMVDMAKGYDNVLLFMGDMDIHKMQHRLYAMLYDKNLHLFDMRLKVGKLFKEPKSYFCAYSYTNRSVEIFCEYIKDYI